MLAFDEAFNINNIRSMDNTLSARKARKKTCTL